MEEQTQIPKVYPPQSEDNIRNISKTAFLSKCYESFIGDLLLPIVDPFLDPGQCGGLKGSSISHYLVKFLHFTHLNFDKSTPHAVLMACVDMSKAFNRTSHQLLIHDLHDMHVPGWLLLLIISYLTERSMVLKYKGCSSSRRSLPGSSPQGVFLGNLFFIIKFNGAARKLAIPHAVWPLLPKYKSDYGSTDPAAIKLKYVEDLSILTRVNLLEDVVTDPISRPRPYNQGERTGHIPKSPSKIKLFLDELQLYSTENLMRINQKKTCIIKFNKSRKWDFPLELGFGDGEYLKNTRTTKILGVHIDSNLKWESNTDFICKHAYSKIWLLRRLSTMGLDYLTILDYYQKEVRSLLELAVPAWHSGLTLKLSADIERVQKVAVGIILGTYEFQYEVACLILGIEPLNYRRISICSNFARKTALSSNSRHKDLFQLPSHPQNTRNKNTKYIEHSWNHGRFCMSPLPYLTRPPG